jgi:hypothetical protein
MYSRCILDVYVYADVVLFEYMRLSAVVDVFGGKMSQMSLVDEERCGEGVMGLFYFCSILSYLVLFGPILSSKLFLQSRLVRSMITCS